MKKFFNYVKQESVFGSSIFAIMAVLLVIVALNVGSDKLQAQNFYEAIPIGISTQVINNHEMICCKNHTGVVTMTHNPDCKTCIKPSK